MASKGDTNSSSDTAARTTSRSAERSKPHHATTLAETEVVQEAVIVLDLYLDAVTLPEDDSPPTVAAVGRQDVDGGQPVSRRKSLVDRFRESIRRPKKSRRSSASAAVDGSRRHADEPQATASRREESATKARKAGGKSRLSSFFSFFRRKKTNTRSASKRDGVECDDEIAIASGTVDGSVPTRQSTSGSEYRVYQQ